MHYLLHPVIFTNIATATDDDVITDSDVTTSLTLPQEDLLYWIFTFDLTAQQTAPIWMYVYGSNSLCTTPHVSLQISMIHEDTSCMYHDTYKICTFLDYNAVEHLGGFCRFRCECQVDLCSRVSVSVIPTSNLGTHTISDVSWQPI